METSGALPDIESLNADDDRANCRYLAPETCASPTTRGGRGRGRHQDQGGGA